MKKLILICLGLALFTFHANGCATLPENFEKPVSQAYTDTDNTRLGRLRTEERQAHPGQSGFVLLGKGLDAFVARAVLAEMAERSLDVQYYLYHKDLVGKLFTGLLLKAADRGVRVRLLVDDMDLAGRDIGAAALDSHPNIEVRIFNPFSRKSSRATQFVTRMGSVTRRMHNKSFTADNQATILGGRNIGNEYFEADPDLAFSDLDVLALGPAAREVSSVFDQYWNSDLAYPATVLRGKALTPEEIKQQQEAFEKYLEEQRDSDYLRALRNSDLANAIRNNEVKFYWGAAKVISDRPEKIQHDAAKKEFHLMPQLRPYLEDIKTELIIFSPYFVPGKEGTAFLAQLRKRGVRVRILTNSLASNDVSIVHSGYAKYRKDLLRAGVELYEMNKQISREDRREKKTMGGSSKASLHAKSFVFDRQRVFIGSLNLDPRAVVHNTEIGVVIDSEEIAQGMADWFDANIGQLAFRVSLKVDEQGFEQLIWRGFVDGEPREFNSEPYVGVWRRLGIGFMRLLPIESQL